MKNRISIPTLAILGVSLFVVGAAAAAHEQERIPREYTNPGEIISFDRQTSFEEAIEIINEFAREHEGRFIIDRTGYTGNIGLSLPPMHWRDALNYILRMQDMVLYQEPEFYEILTRQQSETRDIPEEVDDTPLIDGLDRIATTETREVRINATFFEGDRRALREVGVDWSTLTNNVPANLGDFLGEEATERVPNQFDNRFVSVNASGAQNVSQSVFSSLINFGDLGAGIEVQALFSAFEADNLGETLATPSVMVMDGEQGRIQVGEDFSIKQRDFAGNVTDEFFSTGTILTVTPQIVDYQDTTFIYLNVEVERSSAQPDPVSTVISKEEASTHTLLLNGESTVIAGLYRTERSEVRRGLPILKDLPGWFFGLKYLFGFSSIDMSQNELIVLIQAELEESIPNRMARRFDSKRDLLENQQLRHREELDYISTSELDELQSSFLDAPNNEDGSNLDSGAGAEPLAGVENRSSSQEVSGAETGDQNYTADETDNKTRTSEEPRQRANTRKSQEKAAVQPGPEPELIPAAVPRSEAVTEREERMPVAGREKLVLTGSQIQRRGLSRYADDPRGVSMENAEMENLEESRPELNFYTIGGSFREKENAESLYRSLKNDGYDAHMLYNPDDGLHNVAYAGFNSLDDAVRFTREIQRTVQQEAWVSANITE